VQYLENIARWQASPIDYMVERLGIRRETLDWMLLEEYHTHKWDGTPNPLRAVCEALVRNEWIGVESANATGKTFLGAGLALWFFECFEDSMVITTAPKQAQLQLHIWKEIGREFNKLGKGHLNKLQLRMIEGSDEWTIIGFVSGVGASEDVATRAQGFHATHMFVILEETPGIPQPIIDAFINTSTAPHNLVLALGNPDHQLDTLHRFCRMDNVTNVRISALDHPNIVLKNPNFISGAISEQGIQRRLERYLSVDNPMYLSRVRGISPTQSRDALIRLEWCFEASKKFDELRGDNDRIDESKIVGLQSLGCDVANSEAGDKAAEAYGKGNVLLTIEDFPCPNANEFGHSIHKKIHEFGIAAHCVAVDGVGVGAGAVNALKEDGDTVYDVQSGAGYVKLEGMVEEFQNLRSQMWWQARIDLQKGLLILPRDDELFADLTTPKWTTRGGKIFVESKEEIKKRLGRSPNKGDAFVYWNWVRSQRAVQPAMTGMEDAKDESVKTNSGFRYNPSGSQRRKSSF
jgi:hypothetical protein